MEKNLSFLFLCLLVLSGCSRNDCTEAKTDRSDSSAQVTAQSNTRAWADYVHKGKFDRLIAEATPCYRKAVLEGDEAMQVHAGAYIGQAYILSDKPDSMFVYFNAISPLAEKSGNIVAQTIIANGLGIHALNTALNYNEALAYFQEAMEYADLLPSKNNYYSILSNMTRIYYLREDTTGLKYAREVYRSGVRNGNDYIRFLGAINSAYMYCLTEEYETALRYADEASGLADSMANSAEPDVLHGIVLAAMKRNPEAEHYFRKALNHPEQMDLVVQAEGYLSYGRFLSSQGRYEDAVRAYLKGIALAEHQNNFFYRHRLYRGLAELYRAANRQPEAMKYLVKYQSLTDSIFNIERERSFSRIILRYETEKAEKEMKQQELLLSEERRKVQLVLFIVIVVVVVLAVLYILYIRKNGMYRQLVMQYEAYRQREKQWIARTELQGHPVPETEGHSDNADRTAERKNRELFDALETLMQQEQLFRDKDLSIEKLADRLNTNRTYLSRTLSSRETSFSGYVNAYRIREAVVALSDPENDIPLKMLSDRLGYNSLSSFYRSFQKETGVPPSQYRQQILKFHKTNE